MLYAIDSLLIYDITEDNFKVLVLRVAAAHSKSWKEHRGKEEDFERLSTYHIGPSVWNLPIPGSEMGL